MLLDITPLRDNVAFRHLFASQFISGLGTMVSYVAVPWQLYELTRSNAQVGLLGLVQLVPVVACAWATAGMAARSRIKIHEPYWTMMTEILNLMLAVRSF